VPVRIRIKHVPDGVRLVAGLTATVQVDPHSQPSKRWPRWRARRGRWRPYLGWHARLRPALLPARCSRGTPK
jgi:hypothetical protein